MALLSMEIAIPICAVIGIAFSLVLWLFGSHNGANHVDEEQGLSLDERRRVEYDSKVITEAINKGVSDFLFKEYLYVGVFMVAFAILIILFLGNVERFSTQSQPFTFCPSNMCKPALAIAVSFLLGALTSALSGCLGMKIVICANASAGLMHRKGSVNAYRSGAAMGFLLAAMSLLGLYIAIKMFKCYYGNDWEGLFEVITGYGLGASSMAFFGRAGGGIYAKAVDVYVDLVDRNWPHYLEDPNLSVIPCNVGDIVGDIAGMGTDLFGSYAESCCAALVVASISSFGIDHNFTAMCYPLLISSMGILVCLISTLFTAYFSNIREVGKVGEMRPAFKKQLIISTVLMTFGIAIVSRIALPSSFKIYYFGMEKVVTKWQLSWCVGVGLWAGPIIELFPKYHTNDCIRNIQRVVTDAGVPLASVCAVLASVIIPIYADISFSVGFSIAATYGIAVAALGMLSTIATRLAIDAYDPISHYAERIADMAPCQPFRIAGKGFTIESAALVSIALFSAFVSRAAISHIEVQTPKVLVGFIGGCMLPYYFSTMTMRSVGRQGLKMAQEVGNPRAHPETPAFARHIKISTDEFFTGLILPGALVMLAPILVGTFFGAETLSGVLVGSFSSIIRIANASSNADGPLNKANEDIRAGVLEYANLNPRPPFPPRDAPNPAFGSRWKDTSGPPLCILIQLMAAESLVFARFFAPHRG